MYRKLTRLTCALFGLLALSRVCIHAQTVGVEDLSGSLDQFALNFLAKTSQQVGDSLNLALSPFTVWSLLNILWEGSLENTAAELEKALGLSAFQNKDSYRRAYQMLGNSLTKTNPTEVTLETTNTIYTAADQTLKPDYLRVVQTYYNAEVTPIDFTRASQAAGLINNRINAATRGRIPNFVNEDDLENADVFLTSVLFFKGTWVNQFNETATANQPFYDEKGNQIGEVAMMHDFAQCPFSLILNNRAVAIELAYKGNMSMVVVLPKKNVALQWVLDMMAQVPFSNVITALEKSLIDFGDDPVHIYLPKFSITSNLAVNLILNQMGIRDLLNADRANLLGMFNNYLHVSRVLQRAEIQVNEEGTVASAAAGASLQFKSPPARFLANKPFAYFIYDKSTKGIVFAGKVSNPPLVPI